MQERMKKKEWNEEDDIEGSVYCELCEIWFHRQCEGINEEMFETLSSSEFGFFCTRCTTHKRAFKFQESLVRLRTAADKGIQTLKEAAKVEDILLRNAGPPTPGLKKFYPVDQVAMEQLEICESRGSRY